MQENGIIMSVAMGVGLSASDSLSSNETPFLPDLPEEQSDLLLHPFHGQVGMCPGINPYQLIQNTSRYVSEVEKLCSLPYVVGLKIYLGYYPFYIHDAIYKPIFEIAQQHNIPVVCHTGDLSTPDGLLQYAHPLSIDTVAVRHRGTKIVMAHMGNPWLFDAASVALKNKNVYIDLSGLFVGKFSLRDLVYEQSGYIKYLKEALDYLYSYDKLMYGSDWPFAPFSSYIEFIQEVIPYKYHASIFFDNALSVYQRLLPLVNI